MGSTSANALYIDLSHTRSKSDNVDVELDSREPYTIQNPRMAIAIAIGSSHHPTESALTTLSLNDPCLDTDDDIDAQNTMRNENVFENTGLQLELVKRGTGEPKPMSRRKRRKKYRGLAYDPNS
ncbi:hypothetical protein CVT24_012752 [Panaeolus cyanescens]|uniref:Uncharacterized protein n=1 Tax=Panaeolus cyanescens TaxID=181874 RepID=A0A409YJK1_9AGAR|nr:hypothetical protein CVT24_012752 [Panaeolus cyanescens]